MAYMGRANAPGYNPEGGDPVHKTADATLKPYETLVFSTSNDTADVNLVLPDPQEVGFGHIVAVYVETDGTSDTVVEYPSSTALATLTAAGDYCVYMSIGFKWVEVVANET
jgi:hypothetical protein